MNNTGSTDAYGMRPSLSYFSGEPADGPAEDYVAEVDRVLAAYPMADKMAAYFIYSHLTGAARTEVKLHDFEETDTPAKVKDILVRVFGDKRRLSTLMTEFFNQRQQPGEDILDYSHALSSLDVAIRRKDRDALSRNVFRDKFIDGLAHPTLRKELRHLVGRKPDTTFIEARTEAQQLLRELEEEELQGVCEKRMNIETVELNNELVVLREEFRVLADTLANLGSSQLGTAEHSQGKRKRRSKKMQAHSQVSAEIWSCSDSNQTCSPVRPSQEVSPHTSQTCDEEDEPCYRGWVLLPMPPGTSHSPPPPGKSSAGPKQRSPAIAETPRSPRTHEACRCRDVSHPKIAPGSATQIEHPTHFDRGREIRWA